MKLCIASIFYARSRSKGAVLPIDGLACDDNWQQRFLPIVIGFIGLLDNVFATRRDCP
jgi:hypothetical protein